MAEQPVFQAFDPYAELEITVRDLPHWFQPGVAIFVTFRTFDSMPASITDLWHREQIDWLARRGITVTAADVQDTAAQLIARLPAPLHGPFRRVRDCGWHQHLDAGHGACLLRSPDLAAIVAESIEKFDADRYDLDCFVVMPNTCMHCCNAGPGGRCAKSLRRGLDTRHGGSTRCLANPGIFGRANRSITWSAAPNNSSTCVATSATIRLGPA